MHKNDLISIFEKRLAQLGCPAAQARGNARELADHYDDLMADAAEEGLSETQAEARAAERLGDPHALAERLAAILRQSSWWGRHPVIGFCLLPSVGMFLLQALVACVMLLAIKESLPDSRWRVMADGGAGFGLFSALVQTSVYSSLLILMIFVCRLASRALVGFKWMLATCFICSLHAAFINVWIQPHRLFVGYFTRPNWICAAIPLLCAFVVAIRQRRATRGLTVTLLMAALFLAPSARADEKPALQRGWIGGEYKEARPWSIRQVFFPPPEILYDRSFPKSVQSSQKSAIQMTELGTNTPVALAGLRQGDLILEVDHLPVTRMSDFRRQIDETKPGNLLALTVYRDGQTMEFSAPVGREEYRREGCLAVWLPSIVRPWRLIPDAGLSVVFAGWETPSGLRSDLGSKKQVVDPSWRVWLGIFDFSIGKKVISETNVNLTLTTPKPAMAGLKS